MSSIGRGNTPLLVQRRLVRTGGQAGATAVEAAITLPLFFLSLFTVFFFMIAAYRSVALQMLTSEMTERLAVGAVCQSNFRQAAELSGHSFLVPVSGVAISSGFKPRPGFTQPIFSVTLESQLTVPTFNFQLKMYGLSVGVAETTAC